MANEPLALPLARFPLEREDALEVLVREMERNVPVAGGLPWMVLGYTQTERLAVLVTDIDPGRAARIEQALLHEQGVVSAALCGEALFYSGGGALRNVFARMRGLAGRWELRKRPFLYQEGQLVWLDDWQAHGGLGLSPPELRPAFPAPESGAVRFVNDLGDVGDPNDSQPIPVGATPEDIARFAGHWLESFFYAKGFVPPCAVRVIHGRLEVRLLPRSGPPHAATDLAIRLAQQSDTLAVGTFSRGRDTQLEPPAESIRLRMEWRGGPALTWRRRFRVVAENKARWVDAVGEVLPERDRRFWFVSPE